LFVADFGVSVAMDSVNKNTLKTNHFGATLVGTPYWLAPVCLNHILSCFNDHIFLASFIVVINDDNLFESFEDWGLCFDM
jgi:hypothetical protein